MGESFIVVNIMPMEAGSKLRLKVFGGLATGDVYYFDGDEYCEKTIKIGRMHS